MRKPNKKKMAGVNSRFASVSESIFNGFPLKMLLRSLPVYILKQWALSIRPKIPEIQGLGANGTDIFRNFIPKFWVYLARLA